MNTKILNLVSVLTAAVLLCGSASGGLVVEYDGVYGNIVSIGGTWSTRSLPAGIMRLRVDGVMMDGFCIDLRDRALSSATEYSLSSLAEGPDKAPGPMGEAKASAISKLWSMAYDPDMTMVEATALQVAIWDCLVDLDYNVSGGGFYLTGADPGAQKLLDALWDYTGTTGLAALTNSTYQDYVVTPEPATLVLLGMGSLALLRRRY